MIEENKSEDSIEGSSRDKSIERPRNSNANRLI